MDLLKHADRYKRPKKTRKKIRKQIEKKVGLSPGGRRVKGANFERAIAKLFAGIYNDTEMKYIRRGNQTRSGSDAPDVITPDFWIECKFHSREPNIRKALEQAREAKPYYDDRFICAITKTNNNKPIFSMFLDDMLMFWEKFDVDFDNIAKIGNENKDEKET